MSSNSLPLRPPMTRDAAGLTVTAVWQAGGATALFLDILNVFLLLLSFFGGGDDYLAFPRTP